MIRIQVQLDQSTYDALRARAHEQNKSMSAVAREILQKALKTDEEHRGIRDKTFSFVGIGASGRTDISVNHDEALAEDFR